MFDVAHTISENLPAIKAFWETAGPKISKVINREYNKGEILFGNHLSLSYKKNSHVKLLSSKTSPVKLVDVYVNNNFVCKDNKREMLTDDIFIEDIRNGGRVVVRGNGGTGKTFFLKYFWTKIFHDPRGTIPVFIELRKFNEFHSSELEVFIKYTIANGKDLDDSVYNALLKSGSLVIMLDGFDELVKTKRRDIERQILTLEEKCPDCPLVISSRANAMFEGWTNFSTYDVVGFNLEQVRSLVAKSTVDEDIKSSFLKVLDGDFYTEHQTFLEIPLLGLMMLITFRDTASIPANIDAFYSAVFMTLYQNHDAMKESLDREKTLGLVELQRFFAVFCFLTYLQEKYEFSKTEILEHINKTSKFLNTHLEFNTPIVADAEEILHDIEEAVNLICLDGLTYQYVHRSFQEYFTAFFIIRMEDARTEDLLKSFANRYSDSVIRISYLMKPATVLAKYVVPTYKEFKAIGAFEPIQPLSDTYEFDSIETPMLLFVATNDPRSKTGQLLTQIHFGAIGNWRMFCHTLIELEILKNEQFASPYETQTLKKIKEFKKPQFRSELQKLYKDAEFYELYVQAKESKLVYTVSKVVKISEENLDTEQWKISEEEINKHFSVEFQKAVEALFLSGMKDLLKSRLKVEKILRGLEKRQLIKKNSSIIDMYKI